MPDAAKKSRRKLLQRVAPLDGVTAGELQAHALRVAATGPKVDPADPVAGIVAAGPPLGYRVGEGADEQERQRVFWTALAGQLAEQYLAAARLTADEALRLEKLLDAAAERSPVLDPKRLTPDERALLGETRRVLDAASTLLHECARIAVGAPDARDPADLRAITLRTGPAVTFTDADVAAAQAIVEYYHRSLGNARPGTEITGRVLVEALDFHYDTVSRIPSAAEAARVQITLMDKSTMAPTDIAAALAARRARPDGTPAPLLSEWLGASNWETHGVLHSLVLDALDLRAREDIERRVQEAEREAAEAREEAARLEKRLKRTEEKLEGLSDRTILPGQFVSSGYERGVFTAALQRVEQGELEPLEDTDTTEVLKEGAEFVTSESQLGRLSPAQVRGLLAVFRLFSSDDNGRELGGGPLRVPARMLFRAAGITTTSDEIRRPLFEALRACSSMELYVALRGEQDGRHWVMGDRTHPFIMRPLWTESEDGRRKLTPKDTERLSHEWVSSGARGTTWAGPLPDTYMFELPPIMRAIWHRLVLSGDVLERLDRGAKAARGTKQSFLGLDWRLFVEVTQRVQYGHRTEDGSRFLSFVDRAALLEDYYGAEHIAHMRRRGKYKEKILAQYEKALGVLAEGDLARLEQRDHTTSSGELRDVFAVNPEVVVGTSRRLERAAQPAAVGAPRSRRRLGRGGQGNG